MQKATSGGSGRRDHEQFKAFVKQKMAEQTLEGLVGF